MRRRPGSIPDTRTPMLASGTQRHAVKPTGHAPARLDPPPIEPIRSFLSG